MGPVRRDAHQVVTGVNIGARADWPNAELPPDTIVVPELSVFVLRHFLIVLTTIAIGVGGAFIYVRTATPIFTARAQLMIDPKASQVTRDERQMATIDSAQIESQLAVLRSERIAVAVIQKLDLVANPKFMKPLDQDVPKSVALQLAIEAFGSRLDTRRSGLSYVIDLAFSSPDPQLAAQIVNATADAYIHEQVEQRAAVAREGSEWLESRVAKLREQMNNAALALQEFKAGRSGRVQRDLQKTDDAPNASANLNALKDRNTMEELESTALAYKKIYESALQGYSEALQRQSNPLVETLVLTAATTPLSKSHPRSTLIMAFGLLMGGLVGVGAAILRENLDNSIRSVRRAKQQLGRVCLGALPRIRHARRGEWSARRSLNRSLGGFLAKLKRRFGRPSLECFVSTDELGRDPFLLALANMSTTFVALERTRPHRTRTIGVTSTLNGEGKTMLAGHLSCLLAASGVRVVVIDGDLLKCSMTQAVDASDKPGLIQILLENRRVRDCCVAVPRTRVDLIPSRPFTSAVSETLLGTHAMMRCINEALLTHDFVIVDLPALEQSSAAVAAGPLLDGLLMVVEWGRTPAPLVSEAIERLESTGSSLLGTVLNKAA